MRLFCPDQSVNVQITGQFFKQICLLIGTDSFRIICRLSQCLFCQSVRKSRWCLNSSIFFIYIKGNILLDLLCCILLVTFPVRLLLYVKVYYILRSMSCFIISVSIVVVIGIFICYGLKISIILITLLLNTIIIALVIVIVLDKDSLRGHLKILSKASLIFSKFSISVTILAWPEICYR